MKATPPRRGHYGVDAPYVPPMLAFFGVAWLVPGLVLAGLGHPVALVGLAGLLWLAMAASFLYTTLRGKFAVWSRVLDDLELHGAERLLDIGCGRGAVLLLAAQRLDRGTAHGLDLWRAQDQSGNGPEATRRNAVAEGVADRIELHTGDMAALPFPDGFFDVVVSSLAIHNIPRPDDRLRAVEEAARVLRPGGRLAIADFRHVPAYAQQLAAAGTTGVHTRNLGWRFWYGGPWASTQLVTAAKPAR